MSIIARRVPGAACPLVRPRASPSPARRRIAAFALLVALAVPIARVLAFTVRPQETVTLARVVIAMSLGLVGIVIASINIFGGFAVTGRMLQMFRKD